MFVVSVAGSKRIVSLSRDDTVQIWQFDGKKTLNPKVSIKHYNNTGRWVLPFRFASTRPGTTPCLPINSLLLFYVLAY